MMKRKMIPIDMRKAALLAMTVMIQALEAPAQAMTIFTEDFEVPTGPITLTAGYAPATGPTGIALTAKGWSSLYCASLPCTSEVVTGTGHAGVSTNMLRMTYATWNCSAPAVCDDSFNSHLERTFPGVSELYERKWIRYEPINRASSVGFTNSNNPTMKHHFYNLGRSGHLNQEFIEQQTMYNNIGWVSQHGDSVPELCPYSLLLDVACPYVPNQQLQPMTIDVWYCLESHFRLNSPGTLGTTGQDGIVEQWVNGILTTRYTTAGMAWASDPNALFSETQLYRQGALNLYRYEDDFVVATERIFCGTVPPDTTPPAAPRGLKLL